VVAVFVLVIAASAIVIAWVIRERAAQGTKARSYAVTTETVARLGSAFRDQETGQRGFILTGLPDFLQPYQDGLTTAAQLEAEIRARHPHDELVMQQLDAVEAAGGAYRTDSAEPTIAARRAGGAGYMPDNPTLARGKALFDAVRRKLAALGHTVDQRYADQLAASSRLFRVQVTALVVSVTLLVVLLGLSTIALRRWVTRPLEDIADAVGKVEAGELSTPIPREGPEDVRSLARAVDGMRIRLLSEIDLADRARKAVEQRAAIVLELQTVLTPEPSGVPAGWSAAAGLRPAEGMLAGDCYDLVRLGEDRMVAMVLDIAGHGAVAALTALRCREALRAALRSDADPGAALATLDPLSDDLASDLFLTAFLAVVDAPTGTMRWANAGHPAALLRHGEMLEELGATGPAIGPFPGSWRTATTAIQPGDDLVLYTDGVAEARGPDGFFGADRILAAVARGPSTPAQLVDRLLEEAHEYAGGRLADDATALVLHRESIGAGRQPAVPLDDRSAEAVGGS